MAVRKKCAIAEIKDGSYGGIRYRVSRGEHRGGFISNAYFFETDAQYTEDLKMMLNIVFSCESKDDNDEHLLLLRIETEPEIIKLLPFLIEKAIENPSAHPSPNDPGEVFFHFRDKTRQEHLTI